MQARPSSEIPPGRRPAGRIWRTAAFWALAWAALGFSFLFGGKSVGDVMGGSELWGIMTVCGAVAGAVFGSLYGLLRRAVAAPGGRREPGERLGFRGRLIAGVYGFGAVGLPAGALAGDALGLVILGALGFITAALIPGDADLGG